MGISGWKAAAAVLVGLGAQLLTGCNGFFVYPASTTTTTTSGSSSVDYAFVSNSASGTNYISAYAVSGGSLTPATSSPLSVSYEPQAMVVSTNNAYLFVSSGQYIYGYSIGTGGALSQIGSGALATDTAESMAVSPDGQWLLTLDNETALAAPSLNVYEILSGGTLKNSAAVNSVSVPAVNGNAIVVDSADAMQISPNGNYIAVALGTGGVEVFPFTTSSGTLYSPASISGTASTGFFAVAIDANNDLYITGTNSSGSEVIESFPVSAPTGSVTIGTQISSLAVGNSPVWITVNAVGSSTTSAYVYVANSRDSTISAFSATSGTLTALNSGTAYAGPSGVAALGRDNSGDYVVALGFSTTSGTSTSSGLLPYTITSAGGLSAGTGIATTTNAVPAVVAMTH
jgi:6-phosphogluconolactonase (cycloisomerase 2 family)